jgi:hypothetical protein
MYILYNTNAELSAQKTHTKEDKPYDCAHMAWHRAGGTGE